MNEALPKTQITTFPSTAWVGNGPLRAVLTIIVAALLAVTLFMNGLAGTGTSPFTHRLSDVSHRYDTCITPSSYTFFVWNPIYISLVFITIYSLTLVCRNEKGTENPIWKLGGAVPLPFLTVLSLNLVLNISWLFAWDAEVLLASTILLFLVALTNLTALAFSLNSYSAASSTLQQRSRIDYMLGRLIVNGYGTYTTWTFLASLLNLSILLIYEVSADATTVCVTILSVIPAIMFVFAILPLIAFTHTLTILITPFAVYLWASVGIYLKNTDNVTGSVYALLIANVAVAAVLLVLRLVLVIVRMWFGGISLSPSSVAPAPRPRPPVDPTVMGGG